MKKFVVGMFSLMVASSLSFAAPVDYIDASPDLNDGTTGTDFSGFTHLDITTVSVDNDAVNLYISLSVAQGDIDSPTDWGKYMIGIDSVGGGDTTGNGSGTRPISMSTGMDFWVDTWVDTPGGALLQTYSGGVWGAGVAQTHAVATSLDITIALADLGLSVGNSFTFDVYASGGGASDGAIDALSSATPSIQDWGDAYDTAGNGLSYTVVPEPATLALFAGAGLLAVFRRFRK